MLVRNNFHVPTYFKLQKKFNVSYILYKFSKSIIDLLIRFFFFGDLLDEVQFNG
jgi:hypothetical protein